MNPRLKRYMALIWALLIPPAAVAAPLQEIGNDTLPSNITNTTASIASSDTTITLTKASRHIIIKTDASAAAIYVDLTGGTATSGDFKIDGGGALSIDGPAISSFHYLGASASGNISVLAW